MVSKKRWVGVVLVALFFVVAPRTGLSKGLYEKPVYNPATQSYFELVPVKDADRVFSTAGHKSITWSVAGRLAGKRMYKGTRGRLAIVDSLATHDFLKRNLQPDDYSWFGLRYWCAYRVLQWPTGQQHPFDGFKAWARNWNQSGEACQSSRTTYLAVAYLPVSEGFMWFAKGESKEYRAYIVEYPTGSE